MSKINNLGDLFMRQPELVSDKTMAYPIFEILLITLALIVFSILAFNISISTSEPTSADAAVVDSVGTLFEKLPTVKTQTHKCYQLRQQRDYEEKKRGMSLREWEAYNEKLKAMSCHIGIPTPKLLNVTAAISLFLLYFLFSIWNFAFRKPIGWVTRMITYIPIQLCFLAHWLAFAAFLYNPFVILTWIFGGIGLVIFAFIKFGFWAGLGATLLFLAPAILLVPTVYILGLGRWRIVVPQQTTEPAQT